MGEIADSMIFGEACEMCGMPLDEEATGFPRYCSTQCAHDRGGNADQVVGKTFPKDVLAIKITYKGNKILHVVKPDSSFTQATEIAGNLSEYLEHMFEIKPRFLHPKVKKVVDNE